MFNVRTATRNFAASFCCAMLSMAPVWADDTEIFFGDFADGEVSPNVLFIVDTSGSMQNTVAGTGMSRLDNVKQALNVLLNNLNGVNVGLMKFNNPGGPVLHKVDYIDRNVNAGGVSEIVTLMQDMDDDAQQIVDTGLMIVDGERLEMVEKTTGSATVVVTEIITGRDDAEEQTWYTGDNMYWSSSDLEITHEGGNAGRLQTIGLRFVNVPVPAGATVTNAYITFTVKNPGTGGIAYTRIRAEADETTEFKDLYNNISSRTMTSAWVPWEINEPASATVIVTPDISPVVQEVIGDSDWKGSGTEEDDMVFVIDCNPLKCSPAEYVLKSYDGGGQPPYLTVEYYTGAAPATKKADTGLRFQGVNVPRGAKIVNASIDFSVGQADEGETTNLVIYGENSSTPAAYSSTNKISTRAKTGASVNWSAVESWTVTHDIKSTPDLSPVVQEIVNRGDWCGGNAMAFMIEGSEGLRKAWARDADNGRQPVLRVSYEQDSVVAGSSCALRTVTKQITSTLDDVEESGSSVWTTSTDYDFESTSHKTGLRFSGVNLPNSAKIVSAYLELVSKTNYTGTTNIEIMVQNTDNADPFNGRNNTIDGRTWVLGKTWVAGDWSDMEVVRSPDIGSMVQSIVDKEDWMNGNAMAFRLRKDSGLDRGADSYDLDPLRAARLVVTYQSDGSGEVRTVRDQLLEIVDGLVNGGGTPIADTLYEAALYYTGGEVDYGAYRGSGNKSVNRVSVADSMVDGTYTINYPSGCSEDDLGDSDCNNQTITGSGGSDPTYNTPIDDWCQSNNHIILLTDGEANNNNSEAKIKSFTGESSCQNRPNYGEECVYELAEYMQENDMSPLKENQRITTHTIGFNFSSPFLRQVARLGGGTYKEAIDAVELVGEIQQILSAVLKTNTSFVAPVAAINQFNRLNHRSEIYFAVFRPDETPTWPGNLKKYRLRETDNAVIDYSSTAGKEAISQDTGFFTEDAYSAWGGFADGKEVDEGGANNKMPLYSDRKVFTYYTGSTSKVLSNPANNLSSSNNKLTKTMFNVTAMSDSEFAAHLEWIRGKDVDDRDGDGITAENRYILGDPLHSKPIAVTYGGTEANPDITVFFGANTGFLHAVNSATGVEHFAFLPEATMAQQAVLRTNSLTKDHVYGIDGSVTPWVNDANGDGSISGTGEFVRLFVGQRRGGRNYYALDVTDRSKPTLMWRIEGGVGDFAELGYTWSQPVLGNIDINGTPTDVLYFAGGYDPQQDSTDTRAEDTMGRAIFIVNAKTGELIWSGGKGTGFVENFDDMLYSIPADLSVVDVTSSGQDNMIFVGDLGGQLWRFDINNGAALGDLITGGVIADLGVAGGTNEAANNRRFYHGPDVALLSGTGTTELAVTVGSGYRAHPLNDLTTDRFYMVRQSNVYSIPTTYTKLTEADLYDATDNDVGEGVSGAVALLDAAEGWYFTLPNTGEKVLSTPLTFKNTVTFTTYEPNSASVTSNCVPAAGVSRVYQVNLEDSSPVNEWDDVTGLTEGDRSAYLQSSSIIDEPVIVCTGGGCDMFVGAEKPPVDTPNTDRVVKTFWRKN